ncbi:alpha/beta fold hydrolase [Paenibacillus silvae]|uniref:alpha/beta fold hydrolase n=1 Tax=Paenibacillus silvae TaxID=1325358 RepID=UPI0011A89FF2|nr:alpha/beta hydrolase [Paenibacillus xylanexedens]MCK6073350.1 alpha/beta hydrolase [Paenibacillus silvae]MCK6149174.1 alpha/beta hydrolase [Paenibacillus silvae]MCK6267473.1 alpha/beta hydrolase [Paenibacillus silvae]
MVKQKEKKPGRKRKLLFKIGGGIIAALALFMGIVFVVNVICNGIEKKQIDSYGQYVQVDGKKMNVSIQGDGEQTIVLLPGQGTPTPVLDFKLLIDQLTSDYKVVAIEPFGYGLSDHTDKERTSENIVSEIHEAVEQLGLKRYILMGHSITGLYGVSYVKQYPDEVMAFVGIDSSVPNQPGMDAKLPLKSMQFLQSSGLMRLIKKVSADPYDAMDYDEHTKEQMNLISNQVSTNSTLINELRNLGSNFKNAENMIYPRELPMLLFVQSNNDKNPNWLPLHEEQIKQSDQGKLIPMEGSHYLHHTKYKEIAEQFKEYMKHIKL